MTGKFPKREMPEFIIGKEQLAVLKTVSAVTKALADNPKLAKEIAEVSDQVVKEMEKEIVERITKKLASEVKGVSDKEIKEAFIYWSQFVMPKPLPAWFLFRSPPRVGPPAPAWFLFRSPPNSAEYEYNQT